MSTPPPPISPSGPGGFEPPPGYQPYGNQPVAAPPGNSGMSIAGMVLSLVGLIPCFWFFQVPGLLGMIFGFVGLSQTKGGARRGRGMAITAVVLGIILVLICAAIWIAVAADPDHCLEFGTSNVCEK